MPEAILYEDAGYADLLPLVYWRHVADLRCGARTLGQRACANLGISPAGYWCRSEMAGVVAARSGLPANRPVSAGTLLVNDRWLVTEKVEVRPAPSVGVIDGVIVYICCDSRLAQVLSAEALAQGRGGDVLAAVHQRHGVPGRVVRYPWDLVCACRDMLLADVAESGGRGEGRIHPGAHLLDESAIHVARGAIVKPGAVLDAEDGPIFVDADAVISPNVTVQGPCYVGRGSLLQPGAVIRGGTSIGPVCKVGGEVEASIIHGHANKQHDGFLGHSYVGEWVNIGADTVTSDLKNTYGPVRVPINGREVDSGQTFVGLFVADHGKTGINQAFSTGTVVGFGSSIVTSTLPPKFVPSFAWLTDRGLSEYDPPRCLAVAEKVMGRRGVEMSDAERDLFVRLPEIARRHEGQGGG